MSGNYMLCFVLFLFFIIQANGERTKDKMYEQIDGAAACFRRLNSTHQTGCTSDRPGSTGVIHVIKNEEEDFDFVLNVGIAYPYVVVISINHLTTSLLYKLKQYPERIAGIVVHKNITRPDNFSNEAQCPNENYGLPGSCNSQQPWNPYGTGIMLEDLPFPIFMLENNENLEKISNCFEKFNNYDLNNQNLRSLCSLELSSFMFATINSQTCIRRSKSVTNFTPTRFCDPLGDRNVWSTLFPWENKTDRVSNVILVTARMDTTSLFNDITPGAVTPLTGLVTLMSTAYLLKKMVPENVNYTKNIFFVLFNGESYDYIGSQRFVYDIMNDQFPMERDENIKNQVPLLALSDIKLIVELGQFNLIKELFTHNIKYTNPDQLNKFKDKLKTASSGYDIKVSDPKNTNHKLPPASLQSFLVEAENIEGLLLTDHDEVFANHYYNSVFDDHDNIRYKYANITNNSMNVIPSGSIQSYIANVSRILAASLYEEAIGHKYTGADIKVDHIVDELFHCYMDTANCSIYQAITLKEQISDTPLPLYVGVDARGNLVTSLTGYTLAWLTGDSMNMSQTNCTGDPHNPVYQYVWLSKSLNNLSDTSCLRTTMNFTLAVSPAFVIDDYDWLSKKYSTWTESVWKELYVRMFLQPSHRHEIMTISVGTVTLVLSMALVYFVKTRSDILFAKPETIAPGTSC